MAEKLKISGRILFTSSELPLQNVRIELWDSNGDYGLITSTKTGIDGEFELCAVAPYADLILDNTTIIPQYKVYRNNVLIQEKTITSYTSPLLFTIDDNEFDEHQIDDTSSKQINYIKVIGRITNGNNVAAGNLSINIYEVGLPDSTMIASTTSNWDGYYEATLLFKNIGNSKTLSRRCIEVQVVDSENTLIVSSGNIYDLDDKIEINLTTDLSEYAIEISEFESLLDNIQKVANDTDPFAFIVDDTIDLSTKQATDTIEFLANAMGKISGDIRNVAYSKAYSYSIDVEVPAGVGSRAVDVTSIFYCLCKIHGFDKNPILKLRETVLRSTISYATEENVISSYTTDEIDAFIDAALIYQTDTIKNQVIFDDHSVTINSIALAILGNQSDTDDFIRFYNAVDYPSNEAMWEKYAEAFDETKMKLARKGFSLLPAIGYQPDILTAIMAEISATDSFSPLAAWSESDWIDKINDVGTSTHKLCVPNFVAHITGAAEDPVEVYAKRIRKAIQEFYPTTAIKAELESIDGDKVIEDEDQREMIIKFIGNNPEFDLRIKTIHDINEEDTDLTDISDLEDLKAAIVPLQRLLRATNGSPDAVIALKKDGVDSASAIADMDEDNFISTYKTSLGGIPQAQQAYNTASNIANISTNGAMGAFGNIASLGGPMPGPNNNPQGGPYGPPPIPPPSGTGVPPYAPVVDPMTDPTLANMFGNLDYCCCCHCMSLYSPAAYFTDMLNFLKDNNPDAYGELIRRRPDIIRIDLTCENTNTVLPYVDLVNEILEREIVFTIPLALQTRGTTPELQAHPEHVYKNLIDNEYYDYPDYATVYDNHLANAYYPANLPFNLALEETRVYLKHLGISRFEAMKLFRPYNQVSISNTVQVPHDQLTDFSTYVEYLGLSQIDADIITGKHTFSASSWKFYGLPAATMSVGLANGILDPADHTQLLYGEWDELLFSRVDLLLYYAGITYEELLEFLSVPLLNKYWLPTFAIEIEAIPGASPDTCDLTKLMLTAHDSSRDIFLKFLHRYVRLIRTRKLSIQQVCILSQSLNIVDYTTQIQNLHLLQMGKLVHLSDKLKVKPEILLGWVAPLSTKHFYHYGCDKTELMPSTYDDIFRNKAVFNPALDLFPADGIFTFPSGENYVDNAAIIANVCGITEEEIALLYDFIKYQLTSSLGPLSQPMTLDLKPLSLLYTFSQVAKSLKVSIADFITLLNFLSFEYIPVDYQVGVFAPLPTYDTLIEMDKLLSLIKASPFNIEEINYLVRNVDKRYTYTSDEQTIQLFYENLRNELKKFDLFTNVGQTMTADEQNLVMRLVNTVYQGFSKQFGIPSAIIETIIGDGFDQTSTTPPGDFLGDIIDTSFVNSSYDLSVETIEDEMATPGFAPVLGLLYDMYRKFSKFSVIINKLNIRSAEFGLIFNYDPNANTIIGCNINAYPIGPVNIPVADPLYNEMFRLLKWIQVRDTLNLVDTEFVALLKKADEAIVGTPNAFYNDWIEILSNNSTWGDLIPVLLGTTVGSTAGPILRAISPTNFNPSNDTSPDILLSLLNIVSISRRLGLKPDTIYTVLLGNLVLENSEKIHQAAKGKHRDNDWYKIAKPLRDALRERQRGALASYVMARPSALDQKIWFSESDLFGFFLIDVSMKPCMQTSRIKQAINSVQMFVNRMLLSQEQTITSTLLTFTPSQAKQWETWRKWYRVWEANRKVFLYPENWIEPELRDDKSVFFKELETQLLQDDITDENVSAAVSGYLHKLDEVAILEPVGTCEVKGVTHVISRTYGDPHKYYYRRLENHIWSPWEHIELDINSNHVAPIVWNDRLHLFWLTFKDKIADVRQPKKQFTQNDNNSLVSTMFYNPQSGTITVDGGPGLKQKQIEVTINWSEYNNGNWKKHKIGKNKLLTKLNPLLEEAYGLKTNLYPSYTPRFFKLITDNHTKTLIDLIKSRFFLRVQIGDNNSLDLKLYSSTATTIGDTQDQQTCFSAQDALEYIQGFKFKETGKEPEIIMHDRDWDYRILPPYSTYSQNMRFIESREQLPNNWGWQWANEDKPLIYNRYRTQGRDYYSYFWNQLKPKGDIYYDTHTNILNKTIDGNNVFKVVGRSDYGDNIIENQFFFYDNKNTFFAKRWGLAANNGSEFYIDPSLYNLNLNNPQNVPVVSSNVLSTYLFQTFYHPYSKRFIEEFVRKGVKGVFNIDNQIQDDTMNFVGDYDPNSSMVNPRYPTNKVDFDLGGAYSCYNWELFFHVPMLVAQKLSANQQFAEARKWFHFVFDPTSVTGAISPAYTQQRQLFWKFMPFYQQAGYNIQTLNDILILINWQNSAALAQVNQWQNNPFNPHLVARMRMLSYMKYVVMKYVDNLIAWGDQLYSRNTIESINEATQLYVLAYSILGDRPREIPKRAQTPPMSFSEIEPHLDAFSNAAIGIESYMPHHSGPLGGGATHAPVKMFYFCLSPNDKLLKYWDTIEDRLFKIRNCMNISGQVQQLPLFEPPIDPALLVRATAAGIDISSILNDISNVNLPSYRFTYMLQKANELCSDIKGLGSSLLSALEKKDAEELALLRSSLEFDVLEHMKQIKKGQLDEANANLESLNKTKENIQLRFEYYNSRPYLNTREQEYLTSLKTTATLQEIQGGLQAAASAVAIIPQFHAQAVAAVGASFGGQHLGPALQAASAVIGIKATAVSYKGNVSNILGGYDRRQEDWRFQAGSAKKEIEQIDKQIIGAEIRIAIAEKDLEGHELEMENNRTTDEFMRSKYTNKELYNWMVTQISSTYFQAYRLAYEMAKKAGTCYNHELPFAQKKADEIIQFGYWDSLRKGLLSGERLQYDLRKLEAAYVEENRREFELTKNVSLGMFDPYALIELKNTGSCTVSLPLWLFNLDYPSHCKRRIKSVSISIPCVAGPYTTIACKLALTFHKIYGEVETSSPLVEGDVSGQVIATSGAQNDSGLFEFNFRDERYLPFEAFGAVSTWGISLIDDIRLRQFDFNSISDVIMHVKYTAQEASPTKATAAKETLLEMFSTPDPAQMPRYFSAKHEFSSEWFKSFNELVDVSGDTVARLMKIPLRHDQFPMYCKGKTIKVTGMSLFLDPKPSTGTAYWIEEDSIETELAAINNFFTAYIEYTPNITLVDDGSVHDVNFKLFKKTGTPTPSDYAILEEDEVNDLFIVFEYKLV